jgi:outer membrane protein, heavy metal efflux system
MRSGWGVTCLVIVGGLLLSSNQAFAQPTALAPIRDLIHDPTALASWLAEHNREATAAEARVAQAQALVGASRLHPNPEVEVGLGGIPVGTTNPPGLGLGDSANYSASVSQQLEIGKRPPRMAAARLRLASSQHSYAGALAEMLVDAREAIGRVLYLESRQASIQEQLDTARQIVTLQQARLDRGDMSGIDFDRLRLDAEVLTADLAQANAEYRESLAACANLLFAVCDPGNADLDTVAGLLQPVDAAMPGDWQARLRDRPDLLALDALQHASAQDVTLAQRHKVPDPTVSVGYTRDHFVISGNNPRTLAVGVTIPLPTSDRGQYDAARATAEGNELHETSAAVLERARTDALALHERQTSIAAALDTLSSQSLARANGILTATSEAVNQGELSTTDLLLARRTRTEVALKVMDLQFELFRVQNELRHVLGLDAPILRGIQGAKWTTP